MLDGVWMLICLSYEILVLKTSLTRLTIFYSWKTRIWKVMYMYSYSTTFLKWCIRIHIRIHNFTKYSYSFAFACIRPHVWNLTLKFGQFSRWFLFNNNCSAKPKCSICLLTAFSFASQRTCVIFYSFTNNSRNNPANTRRWTNVDLMLAHRLRLRASIKSTLV